jgi:hypothetical protein
MKKVLLILSILFTGLMLVSCGGDDVVDGAIAKLDTANSALNGVIADPNNITNGFEVPASLVGGVTATWESSEPGIVSFGTASGGFVVVTVNRPALGDGDATVVITATLSIESELEDGGTLTDTWTVTLTVKENTVAELEIENVADVLAITDEAYDGELQVTLNDLTVFAVSGGNSFVYDGTGSIQIYGEALEVGSVYTVAATIEWYYGIWELTDATATLQSGATPQYPTKEVINSVGTYVDALVADGEHLPANGEVADGNFEVVYASVTGVVYMIPDDTGNYNTYIVDQNFDAETDQMPGVADTPADGFMVYYGSSNFTDIRLFNGLEVTMDVVIYTYRSNNNAFAIVYSGGEGGIVPTAATDLEKQAIDANALSIPGSATEAFTLDLPTTGILGSTIVWSFTDSEDTNNSYVDLATGAVTIPEAGQVTVGLTATVSLGTLDDVTVDFELKLGDYPVSTVAEAIEAGSGTMVKVVVVVSDITDAAGYGAAYVQDATGGLNIFTGSELLITEAMIGKTYEIVGEIDDYNGLYELVGFDLTDMVELTGDDALDAPVAVDISDMAMDADTLEAYRAMVVDLSGFVLKYDIASDQSGSFNITMVNDAGEEIAVRLDKDVPGYDAFLAEVAGKSEGYALDVTNGIVGWYYSPQILVGTNTSFAEGTAYTDAQLAATAAAFVDDVEANAELMADVELSETGLFGSTVAWSTSDAAVITAAGVITRPAIGEADATATLSYVVTVGTESTTAMDVMVTVKAQVASAAASDLYFSEYIEGGSYNKAVEIFNGTGADVDLSIYSIKLFSSSDGVIPATTDKTVTLSGTLSDGDVFVLSHADAAQAILDVADLTNSNVANWNGDDAIGLYKNDVLIDVIGFIDSTDPGSEWTVGSGTTKDNTLVRGVVTGPNATFTASEWNVFEKDDLTHIGTHTVG